MVGDMEYNLTPASVGLDQWVTAPCGMIRNKFVFSNLSNVPKTIFLSSSVKLTLFLLTDSDQYPLIWMGIGKSLVFHGFLLRRLCEGEHRQSNLDKLKCTSQNTSYIKRQNTFLPNKMKVFKKLRSTYKTFRKGKFTKIQNLFHKYSIYKILICWSFSFRGFRSF